MPLKYLITGSTGGLGSDVLAYFAANVPHSDFAASSSRKEAASQFESQGLQFRHADYDDYDSLVTAFTGVEKLFFVSSNTFVNEKREKQHGNVVRAAKEVGVGHVYYTSLAFGGYASDSKIHVQQAHLATEKLLAESGVPYTSLREGLYADAFPLFLDWFPDTEEIHLPPSDGPLAFIARADLALTNAKIMHLGLPSTSVIKNNIVLLSGSSTITLAEIVDVINETTGRDVKVSDVGADEFVKAKMEGPGAGKGEWFHRSRVGWFAGIGAGEGGVVSRTVEEVLGRKVQSSGEFIRRLLEKDRDYEWHQNKVVGKN